MHRASQGKYPHGKGVLKSDTLRYEGEFHLGRMHGLGKLQHNGTRYVGSFESGRMHGLGVMMEQNGDRYDGEFERGVKCGRGVMVGRTLLVSLSQSMLLLTEVVRRRSNTLMAARAYITVDGCAICPTDQACACACCLKTRTC